MGSGSLVLTGHDVFQGAPPRSSTEANVAASTRLLVSAVEALQGYGYRFVALDEFLAGRNRAMLAHLTFDDAYCSVYDLFFPLARERAIPFTTFVISGTLAENRDAFPLWMHALRDRAGELEEARLLVLANLPSVQRTLAARGRSSLRALLLEPLPVVSEFFRTYFTQDELDVLGDLAARTWPEIRVTMGHAQLETMMESGLVGIGAHSRTHRSFAMLGKDAIAEEIVGSTEAIAKLTGQSPRQIPFAYPYGALTTFAESMVARHCLAGFTCHNRSLSYFDPISSLPRINLDANAISRARAQSGWKRTAAFVREKSHLHARTGPAWTVIRPFVSAARTLMRDSRRPPARLR